MESQFDEITVLRYRHLDECGHGSRTTIWRKRRAKKWPEPDIFDPNPGWLLPTIKRHLKKQQRAG